MVIKYESAAPFLYFIPSCTIHRHKSPIIILIKTQARICEHDFVCAHNVYTCICGHVCACVCVCMCA